MRRHVAILSVIVVILSSFGALILVGVILDRANRTHRWSFTEVVGYPAAAVGLGLVISLTAWVLARTAKGSARHGSP